MDRARKAAHTCKGDLRRWEKGGGIIDDNEDVLLQGAALRPARGTVYKYSREDSRPAITAEKFNQTNGFD